MKNFNKLVSLLLTISLLLSIISSAIPTYAIDNETEENIVEEKEIVTTTADYSILLNGRINTARLTKIGLYSKLDDEEKDIVCEYYELEDGDFEACEKLGYNIMDSARIIKAANAAEVSPAEYKEYVESYGSEEEASFQLRGYKFFEAKISDEYKSEYTKLMKEGYNFSDLYSTYNVAKKLDAKMTAIVPENPIMDKTATEASEIERFASKYFCDAGKLQKVAADKNISTTAIVGESNIAAELQTEEPDISDSLNAVASTATMSSDTIDKDNPVHSLKHEFITAPSAYFAEANEMVSAVSGELNYRENIVDLKGKNGLDLDLDIVFGGNANMYYGWQTVYQRDEYGEIVLVNGKPINLGEARVDWYNYSDVGARVVKSPLGVGWSFNLPSISYTYERDSITVSTKNAHVWRYHPKSGGAYKIVSDDDGNSNTMTLEDYPRDDIAVTRESGMVDGIYLAYRITFADGRYEVFDENGQIREMGDRWGNKITFDYYLTTDRDLDYDEGMDGALGRITDSLGRQINIGYQSNPSGHPDRLVNINLPDYSVIQLYLEANDTDEPYLLQYINSRPGLTEFTYTSEQLRCTDELFFGTVVTTADGFNNVLNLAAITYNTGLTSRYYYETVPVNNGVGGVKQVKRVTERFESDTPDDVTDVDEVNKLTTYTYGTHDYSGYSKRISVSAADRDLYSDPNDLPSDFESIVNKTQNGVKTKTRSNNKQQPKDIRTYAAGLEESEDELISQEVITYDQYELPIKREKYVGEYIESTEQFEYDSKGNLIKSWSVYADGEKNDEYATVYTYDSTYNLPLSVTYKRDADTTVVENYTLSTDKKTVTEKTVSENGALKEKTQYTYDTYGNVTKERKYKNATQYIDINYDYTDTTGVTRPSNTSFGGAYLTKMWQSGGEDIDGNAIGNVEYTYQYDDMGNQTKVTDPLGNSVQYQYDDYRRVKKITDPAGKTKNFAYTLSTTANTTTYTDEAGTQLKYIYDPAHNLLDILDITSGESLASYDYDQWYRKVAERNVQLETSGFETTYTYDIFNRVTQKETKSTWPYVETVAKETYSYDDGETSPYIIKTQTIVGDNFAPSIVNKEYVNAYGNVEKIGYVTGNNEYFTTYEYDYLGTKTSELAAIADQKDWTNEFTSKWDYDYAGRVLRQYNANNNYISYEYDWLGRVTKAYDAVANTLATPYYTAYLYDDLGNVIQETVPQTATTNKVTKYKYDKLGRVILESRLHDIHTGAEQYRSTSYEYDWRGNPTEVTQGGYFSTTYTYDDLGRPASTTTDGKTTTYTYDRFGNVLTETFGGKTDTYEYDMNMFRTKHIHPSGKRITYEPNAIGQTATIMTSAESGGRTFDYTLTGQLLQASDASYVGRIRREYDDRGNVIYEENTGLTKEYTYDISGKRESMIAEGSGDVQSLTYSYNNLEQLEGVGGDTSAYYQYDANGNVVIAMENGHDEYSDYNRDNSPSYSTIFYLGAGASSYNTIYYLDGNIKSETFFDGTTKTYTYNTRNMLSSETFSTGKVVNYSYNGSGNRASMTETENGQSTVTEYVYDELNRLTRHYTESPNGDTDRTYYSYDEDGNLILRSRETATTGTATNTFSFGTSSPSVDTFKYNGYGEMSQAVVGGVTTNYTYYADGLRRTKTTNGVTTVHMWDGDNIIADLDGNYALKTGYARAHDLSTIYNADGDEWYYIMSDRGDTIQMYNDTTETNYLYDAYGNQQTEATTDINPFRYSGEYYDAETGFIYLRARYYDPTIGRFISEDPIRDGLNWYAYCENNPVMFVDPTGLDSYVFYDPNMYGDGTGEKYALELEKQLNDYYHEGNDATHIIPITSEKEFIEKWGHMGRAGSGTIEGVLLLFHGDDDLIQFGTHASDGPTGNFTMSEMNKLASKTMDTLTLLSCDPGHISSDPNVSNFATQMTKRMNASYLIASDGHVRNPIIRPWYGFGIWFKYIKLETDTDPKGFKVYTKNSNGKITATEIGSSFENLKKLIEAAKK